MTCDGFVGEIWGLFGGFGGIWGDTSWRLFKGVLECGLASCLIYILDFVDGIFHAIL